MKEKVLDEFQFLVDDRRWGGSVEVVETNNDGNVSVDLRLRIGYKTISLPRRGREELLQALTSGFTAAKGRYAELVSRLNGE